MSWPEWGGTRPNPFTYVDAEGEEVDLITTARRDVRKRLTQGVAHQLGRELAEKEWPGCVATGSTFPLALRGQEESPSSPVPAASPGA